MGQPPPPHEHSLVSCAHLECPLLVRGKTLGALIHTLHLPRHCRGKARERLLLLRHQLLQVLHVCRKGTNNDVDRERRARQRVSKSWVGVVTRTRTGTQGSTDRHKHTRIPPYFQIHASSFSVVTHTHTRVLALFLSSFPLSSSLLPCWNWSSSAALLCLTASKPEAAACVQTFAASLPC